MNLLTFDLNLLRVFDVVMTEQNLTRAADRLATTQPAVSNALRRLRDAVDDELVVRTARGVRPTPRAEQLWPAVRQALSLLEGALTTQQFTMAETAVSFRLAMVDATAALLVPPLKNIITRDAPNVDLRIAPLMSRDPRPALLRGDVDLAAGNFPGITAQILSGHADSAALCHEPLYRSEYVCVMRKGHVLSTKPFDLDAYCGAEHALVSFSGRAYGPVDDLLERMDRKRRTAVTVNQFFTLFRLVAETDLLAVVPRHLIDASGIADQLACKPVPFELPPVQVDMVWHERHTRDPAHAWLRQALQSIPVPQASDPAGGDACLMPAAQP